MPDNELQTTTITVTNEGRAPFGFFGSKGQSYQILPKHRVRDAEVALSVARMIKKQAAAEPFRGIKVEGNIPDEKSATMEYATTENVETGEPIEGAEGTDTTQPAPGEMGTSGESA